MTRYPITTYAVVLTIALGYTSVAFSQLSADLSASPNAGALQAEGLAANLSSTGSYAGSGKNELRSSHAAILTGGSSPAIQSISRTSIQKYEEGMQESLLPSLKSSPKPSTPGLTGGGIHFSPIRPVQLGSTSHFKSSTPRSAGRYSSTAQTPLYSFLLKQGKRGSRSTTSRNLSKRSSHNKSSSSKLMQSLGGTRGSSLH